MAPSCIRARELPSAGSVIPGWRHEGVARDQGWLGTLSLRDFHHQRSRIWEMSMPASIRAQPTDDDTLG